MSVQDKPKTPQHSASKSGIMPRPDLAELEARREAPQQPSSLPEARDKDGATTGILDQPGSIAITASLAKKIFGNDKAVGKTIKLNQNTDLNVSAVLADPPANSHLQFDLLHSLVPAQNEDGLRQALETWQGIFCFTYLLLDKPLRMDLLLAKVRSMLDAPATDLR